ncbi:MAG: serine acetyltransferase [Chlamydiales bacterium]|nr:serine acetyltransferase [Chlamydiia bacterium]MCP5508730.1 serine acetyltransferase [Chlamydiales bacterium]
MFPNLREDWKTYDGDLSAPGFWVMVVYRFGRWRYRIKPRVLRIPFSILYKLMYILIRMMSGIELPCEVQLGRRVRIDHFSDIIISGDAVIGDDVVIRNGVTIGLKHTDKRGSPTIGSRVDIGAGAKILGPITIGDDVVIGANAVVIENVPSNSLAVGVPARVIPRKTHE